MDQHIHVDARSNALRAEAHALIEGIGIGSILEERFGSMQLVGSVDLDLMTWRDIDIYVPVEPGAKQLFVDMVAPIESAIEASGCCLVRAVFNDEWAVPRGDYGRGYYWGLRVRAAGDELWKIDLWGWDETTYAAKIAEHRQLKEALAGCNRERILELKSQAMELPGFRDTITSWHVYQFILEGGTSFDELRSFATSQR